MAQSDTPPIAAHEGLFRRHLRRGEYFAIDPRHLHIDAGDPKAFFFLFGPAIYPNERCGSVEVVRIDGPLEHHGSWCDSYERIAKRVERAFCGRSQDEEDGEDEDGTDYEPPDPASYGPPSHVVLRIDSPGGDVAGLNAFCRKLRAMKAANPAIPLVAFADEKAYSAAYAISSMCDYIYLPDSGFVGSIGVISTMLDLTSMDKKLGIKYFMLTSGKRKADGHPHAPITTEMLDEERPRVEKLAMQFFNRVKQGRGLSVDEIRGFQAKRFLGDEAVSAGVADGILDFDDLIAKLNKQAKKGAGAVSGSSALAPMGQRVPTSRAKTNGTKTGPNARHK